MSDIDKLFDDELAAAELVAAKDDEIMAAAARGKPFWGAGKAPASADQIVGLDDFVPGPTQPERPPVEHYLRCSITVGDLVIEPGLELRTGDDIDQNWAALMSHGRYIGELAARGDRISACRMAGVGIEHSWPGRAWFVEIHDAKLERWTQSFQPYGVPRSR